MNNQANTNRGTKAEQLFADTILEPQCSHAFKAICESLEISNIAVPNKAEVIGSKKRKTDVEISFKDINIMSIRVTIKRFEDFGYNHLERRGFVEFCKRNQFTSTDTNFLKDLWLRKAADTKNQKLVEDNEKERVKGIFSKVESGISAVLGSDHPQILALYSANESKWHIYNICDQVLNNIRGAISFTSGSSNITIGNYIVIQRKGSNSGESGGDPLKDIDHGANNVQIKMRVKSFFDDIEPLTSYIA